MTIRLCILYLLVAGTALYAWRDWYIGLLGLIALSSIMNHPDMPREWFGVTGLNTWNILFCSVFLSWYSHRGGFTENWDAPLWGKRLLVCYIVLVAIAVSRAIVDRSSFPGGGAAFKWTPAGLMFDYLLNPLKYLLPGIMLFDGTRTRRKLVWALVAVLFVPFMYSVLVSRHIHAAALSLPYKQQLRVRRHIGKVIGFHANTCSQVLAGSVWGTLAFAMAQKRLIHRGLLLGQAGWMVWGLLLCLSRAGYWAFAGVGAVFSLLIWRLLLIVFPVALMIATALVPAIPQRLMAGFNVADEAGNIVTDMDEVTAGRTTKLWPHVINAIWESPVFGYGRLGIYRCSAASPITESVGYVPDHPHNGYLELLLDMGVVGTVPVLGLYGAIVWVSFVLARDKRNRLWRATGCAALGASLSLVIMCVSGQSFFPREANQVQWCLYGLVFRVYVERARSLQVLAWMRARPSYPDAEAVEVA